MSASFFGQLRAQSLGSELAPDLNPIEHLWFVLKKRLYRRHFRNADELFQAIQEEWMPIPPDTILGLVESIPRRMRAVIKAKGYATKY
uniref:Tc1-like transposase DDE domain-containing protein n=1 Tax=Acrobeloides nanus TaxID=290746 RepID=A0A914D472_9BILA